MQPAWGLSSVLFGRRAFSRRTVSRLPEQREEDTLRISPQTLAPKCRNSGALCSLSLQLLAGAGRKKRGASCRPGAFPTLLSGLWTCPCLPALPTSHHAVAMPRHEPQREQEECAGRRGLAWPAQASGYLWVWGLFRTMAMGHGREGGEPRRGLGVVDGDSWGRSQGIRR